MKETNPIFWRISPLGALLESGTGCLLLLIPMFPVLIDAPPLPRSLYLVLLPLVCAVIAGSRMRFQRNHPATVLVVECGLAACIGLGLYAIIMGVFASAGHMDSILYSYAGPGGTRFFILLAAPEYLSVRLASLTWRRWNRLRSRRYAWALTHAILTVVVVSALLVLSAIIFYSGNILGNDIWGIPPDSAFSRSVFWLSMLVLFSFFLIVGAITLFLPPATLFSFLVARKMTVRLEDLALAANALRQGDLSKRVDVKGADEIAQLQADFNAMAADLEKTMHDLEMEKDKVWSLIKARRDLVAGISHELRNPIAITQGYLDSLQRNWQDRSPHEIKQDLETISYEASRLNTILNDLLAFSQLDAGHLQISLKTVNVSTLLQRVEETFSKLSWSSKRVKITLAAPEDDVFVQADPLRLEQILVNLVQNAVRHTSPGGLVALEVRQDKDTICIEVEDTGEGIPPEELDHIWEKYHHAESSKGRNQSGAGLGLALVKELTEAMGGKVKVESWPEQGSIFRINLAAATQSQDGG
ncbi:MAG: HAMP domain-containing histidine kinase [Anaerolineales bacterium]|nr:HAMP domain-containing histidine kinase [Anaerolineales bacterium]